MPLCPHSRWLKKSNPEMFRLGDSYFGRFIPSAMVGLISPDEFAKLMVKLEDRARDNRGWTNARCPAMTTLTTDAIGYAWDALNWMRLRATATTEQNRAYDRLTDGRIPGSEAKSWLRATWRQVDSWGRKLLEEAGESWG